MESGLIMSSHNVSSSLITTGANFCKSKHPTNNVYYARFHASKVSQHKREIQTKYNASRFQLQSSLNDHGYKYSEGKLTHEERNKKYIVQATPTPSFDSETFADKAKKILDLCFQLCYPYSTIGITIAAVSASFLPVEKLSDISLPFIIGVFQALLSHVFSLLYIGAVNQLFDFEIDKINKPEFPLASEQSSIKTVQIIAATYLTLSFGITLMIGSWPLFWNNLLQTVMWSIYSYDVPLLRWKKDAVLALISSTVPGGFVVPILLFMHAQTFLLKMPFTVSRSLITTIVSITLYMTGINFAKDISDVEGDRMHGIDTFAIRWGPKRVFWICNFLFQMAFGVAFLAGITSPYLWIKIVTGMGIGILASISAYQAKHADLSNKSSARSYYMSIWKILYALYFVVAFIR